MAIGSLGDISFEVSDKKVFAFEDLKREGKMRYATHEVIGQKPILELVGPELEQISFKINLSVSLGINPEREMQKLRDKRDAGEVMSFVLGPKVVGKNKWVIENISETQSNIDNRGNAFTIAADITIKEYVERVGGK